MNEIQNLYLTDRPAYWRMMKRQQRAKQRVFDEDVHVEPERPPLAPLGKKLVRYPDGSIRFVNE